MSERLYAEVQCQHGTRLGQITLPVGAVAVIVQPYVAHCGVCLIERNGPHCKDHDLPLDGHGKCKECYLADEDWRRTNADIDHLWRNR